MEIMRKSWETAGRPKRVAAAVSGGADSMAMLIALEAAAQEEGFFLCAVQVDHGLRPDSGQDAEFVENFCRERAIPCQVKRVQVAGKGENGAREARYEALFSFCRDMGADALALAHHRRDQAETLLLHLFRGSGGVGLSGMPEWQERCLPDGKPIGLWRPFLDVSPQMLRKALLEKQIPWREDSTNGESLYLRNFLRLEIMPPIETRLPGAEAAMARAAEIFRDEQDYFRQEAEKFLLLHGWREAPFCFADGEALDGLHIAVKRHAVRLLCPVPLNHEETEAVAALKRGQTANLSRGFRAYRTEKRLHFLPKEGKAPSMGNLLELPFRGETGDGIFLQAVPKSLLEGCELRFRRPGDRIHPLGAKGEKSLQDYWTDKKIDAPFREHLPLLCKGNKVLWSIGVGPGEEARIHEGENILLLKYDGALPPIKMKK